MKLDDLRQMVASGALACELADYVLPPETKIGVDLARPGSERTGIVLATFGPEWAEAMKAVIGRAAIGATTASMAPFIAHAQRAVEKLSEAIHGAIAGVKKIIEALVDIAKEPKTKKPDKPVLTFGVARSWIPKIIDIIRHIWFRGTPRRIRRARRHTEPL